MSTMRAVSAVVALLLVLETVQTVLGGESQGGATRPVDFSPVFVDKMNPRCHFIQNIKADVNMAF